jgi:glycosyltransferase involved in cell wall biosynthesis
VPAADLLLDDHHPAMRSVLVVHPYLAPVGGGNAVAAWALQALREEFAVSLATLCRPDLAAVDRSFGTSLQAAAFTTLVAPRRYRLLLSVVRTPGALLDCQLTVRLARNLDRARRFDVLFSTHNEVDFGRRGIQYVNFPGAYQPGRELERRWSHRVPGLHSTFRALCYRLGRGRPEGARRNVFLADSEYIASRIRADYGADAVVLYPPVGGPFPSRPWHERQSAVVAVGRLVPAKRWDAVVAIVEELRRRGRLLTLTLIGHREDGRTEALLEHLASQRPWFRLLRDLDREQLHAELAAHRYGLHAAREEHFGIAPAEMLAAGCLPFVHNSGGPPEIVGHHPALTWNSDDEAVERIAAVLCDADLEERLRRHTAEQQPRFSTATFGANLRSIVRTCL